MFSSTGGSDESSAFSFSSVSQEVNKNERQKSSNAFCIKKYLYSNKINFIGISIFFDFEKNKEK